MAILTRPSTADLLRERASLVASIEKQLDVDVREIPRTEDGDRLLELILDLAVEAQQHLIERRREAERKIHDELGKFELNHPMSDWPPDPPYVDSLIVDKVIAALNGDIDDPDARALVGKAIRLNALSRAIEKDNQVIATAPHQRGAKGRAATVDSAVDSSASMRDEPSADVTPSGTSKRKVRTTQDVWADWEKQAKFLEALRLAQELNRRGVQGVSVFALMAVAGRRTVLEVGRDDEEQRKGLLGLR